MSFAAESYNVPMNDLEVVATDRDWAVDTKEEPVEAPPVAAVAKEAEEAAAKEADGPIRKHAPRLPYSSRMKLRDEALASRPGRPCDLLHGLFSDSELESPKGKRVAVESKPAPEVPAPAEDTRPAEEASLAEP